MTTDREPVTASEPSTGGRHPYFLGDPALDELLEVCLQLGGELWVTRARLARLERLVEVDGRPASEILEERSDGDEDQAAWVAERDAFVARIFSALARRDHVSAGDIV